MATTSSSSVRPALRVVPAAPVTPLPTRSQRDAHAPPADPPAGRDGEVSPPPTVSPLARLGVSRHPSTGGPARPTAPGPGRAHEQHEGVDVADVVEVADPVDLALRRLRRALDTGSGEVDRLMARPGRRRRRGPAVRIFGDGAA
jgi:hypothetical protein